MGVLIIDNKSQDSCALLLVLWVPRLCGVVSLEQSYLQSEASETTDLVPNLEFMSTNANSPKVSSLNVLLGWVGGASLAWVVA